MINSAQGILLGAHLGLNRQWFEYPTMMLSNIEQQLIEEEKSYSDDTPFDEETAFDFYYPGSWFGPCIYSKASDSYTTRDSLCSQERAFFCSWQGLDCPTDETFHDLGHAGDGRTCVSIYNTAENLSPHVCDRLVHE